jgi:hypothetical protein
MAEKKRIRTAEEKGAVRKANAAEDMPPEPEWLFYILSFFVQIAGLVIGAIYMGKPNEECRRFGKNCIIAAIIPFLLYCLCICIYILLTVASSVFYVVLMMLIVMFAGVSGGEYAFIGALVGLG